MHLGTQDWLTILAQLEWELVSITISKDKSNFNMSPTTTPF